MNCFRHQDSSAVGLCKTCFKAVCPECAADVGNGLACKNSCEEKVLQQNAMHDRALKIYGLGKDRSRIPSTGVIAWFLMAFGMWFLAGLSYLRGRQVDYPALVIAIMFTAVFGLAYWNSKRTGLKC
jgi:hypothetical protein